LLASGEQRVVPDDTSPRAIAEELFERMGDDRRDTIGELLADDVRIVVPGGAFEGPDAATRLLDHLAPRYDWAAKEFNRWIETESSAVSIGTLYGVDNDGGEFEGVRYVDVFDVEDGRIVRWEFWNDLAVDGVVEP